MDLVKIIVLLRQRSLWKYLNTIPALGLQDIYAGASLESHILSYDNCNKVTVCMDDIKSIKSHRPTQLLKLFIFTVLL